jgi:hypothetical protein
MIVTADSQVVRESNRRPAKEGWNTLFLGANRYSLKQGEPEPDMAALFPVAFLVEKNPGAVVQPHYHAAEQFQVVVAGSGRMGLHPLTGVAVHYTGPYSSYGPIVAAEDGLQWFTLRNGFDQGAQYMPAQRLGLREGRARHPHREAAVDVPNVFSAAELARLTEVTRETVLAPADDGVGTWRYRLPPGAEISGPAPSSGGGQYWLVLEGSMAMEPGKNLPRHSCGFVAPDAAEARVVAGAQGAEILCMQFARRASH